MVSNVGEHAVLTVGPWMLSICTEPVRVCVCVCVILCTKEL